VTRSAGLLALGCRQAIAARLDISDQTVKSHVASICGKLGAVNRTDASASPSGTASSHSDPQQVRSTDAGRIFDETKPTADPTPVPRHASKTPCSIAAIGGFEESVITLAARGSLSFWKVGASPEPAKRWAS